MLDINQTMQFYRFLSELNVYGIIGLTLCISLIIFFSVFLILKDHDLSLKIKFIYSVFTCLFFFLAIILMKVDANSQMHILHQANKLKSELINRNWTVIGFNRIKKNLGNEFDSATLAQIVKTYPSEFMEINDLNDDQRGIKLVDNTAVERIFRQQQLFAPFLIAQVVDHMKFNGLTTMTCKQITTLDIRFDRDQIDVAISLYPNELIPINLTVNGEAQKGVKLAEPQKKES